MKFPVKRRLYESMPGLVKRLVCVVPFSWIAGGAYRTAYRRGDWYDRASPEELALAQERRLGELLRFVVTEIPAYQHLRRTVERHKAREALKEFPLLDKEALQADMGKYLPRAFDRLPHYQVSTGGTSGKQLKFYLDDHSHSTEMAFVHRYWKEMGYLPGQPKATFRGVSFPRLPANVFWQYNPVYNEVQFSPFHMREEVLGAYVREISRFRPRYIHGYPSAVETLAEYVYRNNLSSDLSGINAAFLTSESCTLAQRERIERAFRTRVFSWYGHSERLIFGGECKHSAAYHQVPDYGVLEIINDRGDACEREGERGELVGTGLNGRCMPLVRYRTGDYATRLESRCACGRFWDRFTDVEGRWKQDAIVTKSGSRISLTALNMHGPLFERVVRFQYYQAVPGRCTLKIVAAPTFSERDRTAIAAAYRAKIGEEVEFSVELVDAIPLTARGKVKMLDSRLMT